MKLKIFNSYLFFRYFLILSGFFIFSLFIWARFIRERLPKVLPLNLSWIGLFILIEICFIYLYLVYTYSPVKTYKEPNPAISTIVELFYTPLIAFDTYIKNIPFIKPYQERFIVFLAYKFNYIICETSIFYFVFAILPRLVLVSALVIDTVYFHKLHYIYKVLLIGVLLFLNRYISYSFKYAKESLIEAWQPFMQKITCKYFHGVHDYDYVPDPDDPDDEEDCDMPTMCLSLKRFIELQKDMIMYGKNKLDYLAIPTVHYFEIYLIKNNVYKTKEDIPNGFIFSLSKEHKDVIYSTIEKKVDDITQLALVIESYSNTKSDDRRYKNILCLVFSNYLLCWLYILIISMNKNAWIDLLVNLSLFDKIENPFI